jgi:four helix bundle protein
VSSPKGRSENSKKPHRNLIAWQIAMDLAYAVYRSTAKFPKEEVYGLVSQLRRAAVSVPSNIAEGAAGRTRQQFVNFLSNAIGSLNELDTQLELALRLDYVSRDGYDPLQKMVDECLAVTYGLKKSLKLKSLVSTGSSRQV